MPLTIDDLTVNFEHPDREALLALLRDREFVIERLTAQLVGELRAAGLVLEAGQVYSWKKPPALGGTLTADNAEVADLEVQLSLMGQLHRQIADLPEGTPISEVRLEGP